MKQHPRPKTNHSTTWNDDDGEDEEREMSLARIHRLGTNQAKISQVVKRVLQIRMYIYRAWQVTVWLHRNDSTYAYAGRKVDEVCIMEEDLLTICPCNIAIIKQHGLLKWEINVFIKRCTDFCLCHESSHSFISVTWLMSEKRNINDIVKIHI